MIYYFCTYLDENYLPRGLAMYRSLQEHCPDFKLWVLCMDHASGEILKKLDLPGVYPISLDEFERNDPLLLSAKQNRSKIEYYFTCTPSLPLYILNNWHEIDLITYLDADLFFFASPTSLFKEQGNGSIAIIGHRFPPGIQYRERYGIYNVGWLSFRRDENALACLNWWRERCIEWCHDREEDGRFADQKYLDDWPSRFQGVVVLANKGANLAPWNLANYKIHADRNSVCCDGQPLLFYHFHGFKRVKGWIYNLNINQYKTTPSHTVLRHIYQPYINTLSEISQKVEPLASFAGNSTSQKDQRTKSSLHWPDSSMPLLPLVRKIEEMLRVCAFVLVRRYVFVVNGRII